jgi:hypothetical protein
MGRAQKSQIDLGNAASQPFTTKIDPVDARLR